jgi:predicted dinucleotide-binding enzyme
MRILIAGCGDVGAALGVELATGGHEVWGLRRDPAGLPAAIRPLRADLTRPATLIGLVWSEYSAEPHPVHRPG